jgi:O-acetyl-ADP-ribose deacetylase (regulator of RNase III)
MITYQKGSILETKDLIIMHGVNCQGKMAAGVAKIIRDAHPIVYDEYLKHWQKHVVDNGTNSTLLGTYLPVFVNENLCVINIFSQLYYGHESDRRYISYDALDTAFRNLSQILFGDLRKVSMPAIGYGLGGGDWDVIAAIINHRLKDFQVTVWSL